MSPIYSLLVIALIAGIEANRICRDDTHCANLGRDLICLKQQCDWGFCSCPRHYVARFHGSEQNFRCVPVVKVGEKCDDGQYGVGVCGAPNSECINGTCTCRTIRHATTKDITHDFKSYWNGEMCATEDQAWPGETASGDFIVPANCNGYNTETNAVWDYSVITPKTDMFGDYPQCACPVGYRTELMVVHSETTVEARKTGTMFLNKKAPYCIQNKIGVASHHCRVDRECPGFASTGDFSTGSVCKDNYCQCRTSGYVPNYARTSCHVAIAGGGTCSSSVGTNPIVYSEGVTTLAGVTMTCDGAKGLICGNVCAASYYAYKNFAQPLTAHLTCVCGPAYSGTTSCTPRGVGAACYGDHNCRAVETLGYTGRCHEGKCAAGASAVQMSIVVLAASLLMALLK